MPNQNGNARIYTISTEMAALPAQTMPDLDKLKSELTSAALSVAVSQISFDEALDQCTVTTDVAPSGADQSTMDSAVGAHDGIKVEFVKTHYIEERKRNGLILKKTWFAVESAGVYTHPIEETSYTYQGRRLKSETVTTYSPAGDVLKVENYDWETERVGGTVYRRRKKV